MGCIYKVTPPGKSKSELRGKKPHLTDGKTEAKGKKKKKEGKQRQARGLKLSHCVRVEGRTVMCRVNPSRHQGAS